MIILEYKVGDKVRVRSLEWYNNHKNKNENINCSGSVFFVLNMSKFCGSILTIKNIDVDMDAYKVEENDFIWTNDMFEKCVAETSSLSGFGLWENKIQFILFSNENYADKVELCLGDDYEIVVEDGRTFVQRKKPKYPTTYEECCGILGMTFDYPDIRMVSIDEYNLYSNFIQLIRCRDAYWKLADNWKPNWNNDADYFYTIKYNSTHIRLYNYTDEYAILAFPTEEMRDAFYENFKDLIEKCKELL